MTNQQFPDLIKAGLKVGDKVYSYLYEEGEGKVVSLRDNKISVDFNPKNATPTFNSRGIYSNDRIPSITMQPWNPVAGEPFPFPKWEPKEGEWCAFWDNGDTSFIVGVFDYISDGKYLFKDSGAEWDNCAPISEAMQIFGITKSE